MLETLDLTPTLSREEYRSRLSTLRAELRDLQYRMGDHGISGIVVLEGWSASGKGVVLSHIVDALDPRWMRVHPITAPVDQERCHPFLWRFWIKTPRRGMLTIFDQSWYGRVLGDRVEGRVRKCEWRRAYEEISQFERWLAADGTAIIKIWLHITRKEQGKRFRKLVQDETTAWEVTRDDWRQHRRYGRYLKAVEDMLQRTSTAEAPWCLIPAMDRYIQRIRTLESIAGALRCAIAGQEAEVSPPAAAVVAGAAPAGGPGPRAGGR